MNAKKVLSDTNNYKYSVEIQPYKLDWIRMKKGLILSATTYKCVRILSSCKNQYMMNWTRIDAL